MTTRLSFNRLRASSVALTSRLLAAALAAAFLGGASLHARSDGPEPSPSGSSSSENDGARSDDSFPGYRFWKAPVESIDHWPWGTEKYYPIKIEQFDKWLDVTDEIDRLNEEEQTVRGVAPSLTLEARLSDDALVGVGEFSTAPVSAEGADVQEESESAPYLLRSFSFATSPYSSDEKVDLMEAIGAYADGRFYLPNSKAASRKFFWSQRGTLDRRDRLTFNLRFPDSLRTELKLVTPYDVMIEAVDGVATEIASESESDDQPGVSRTWRVYFGSRPQATLRATRGAAFAFPEGARKIGVRQESSYRMTREGLELNARLEFERLTARPEEIALFLDKRLRLVSAEWGAVRDLDVNSTSADDQFNKIVIKTPGQLETLDDLKLTAFGPVELDKTSSLPPLTFEEDSAFYWRETTLRLTVVRPLVVSTSTLTDALPFREAFRARQEGVEVLSYKLNNAKGVVAVKVCSYEKTPPFDSATDCLIAVDAVSAKTTLFYNFSGVESSGVTIPIAPNWSIRSVSSLSDDLISWSFDDGEAPESAVRKLSVSFRKTPASDRPVKIDVSARMVRTDADAPIDVDKLCPIDLTDNLRGAHALALRAESPYQVKLTTRSGRPYSAPNTDPNFVFSELALRDATPASSSAKRLYFGAQTVDAAASLENLRSTYSTTGTCECEFYGTIAPDNYVEKWNVRCEPLGGSSVDRVVFYVPGALEGTKAYNAVWKWSSSLEPDRLNTATRLSAEDAKLYHIPEKTAAYEMRLSTLASSPFDLNMTCEDAFSKRSQPFLAVFPESSNSTLEIVVDSPQGFRFETHFVNMRETTVPIAVDGEYETLKKAFRYESNSGRRDAERIVKDADPNVDDESEPSAGFETSEPELTVSFENSAFYGAESENALPPSARCWLERLDSFFQSNGKSRNRALFYIENQGRADLELRLPQNVGETAIRDVWIDGRSALYGYLRDSRSIVLQLPLNRRFVCVTVEYDAPGERLAGGERLTPSRLSCDVPVLSGEWNVWTPPQYQTRFGATRDRIDERVGNSWVQSLFSLIALGVSERRVEELSTRFLERLGDADALAAAVSESRKIATTDAGGSSTPKSGSGNGALTWGDVLGDPLVVNWLFAPPAKTVAQTDDEERLSAGTKTPFGVLDASFAFNLYVDRIAAAYASLTPSTPVPNSTLTSHDSRARQMIEDSKFALVFIDEKTAVLTTCSVLNRRLDVSISSMGGGSVFRVNKASDVRKARAEIASGSRRFISSQEWRLAEAAVSPWRNPPQDEFAVGWNRTNVSLSRVESGVRVVNRYFLWALELFCFIGFIATLWRFNLASVRLCVGSLGVCAAALNVVTFEWFAATLGVAYGALLVLCILLFIPRDALRRTWRTDAKRARKERRSDAKVFEVEFSDQADASSTEGFVDFNLMPSEERRRLKGVDEDDKSPIPSKPDELRPGTISMKTTIALTLVSLFLFSFARFASSNAQDPPTASAPAANQAEAPSEPESNGESTWREPYRVFVPVDENGETVGDYYWVGSEFYDSIRSTLNRTPRERNWRVVDARYEGSVNYNATLGATTLFNLKATYTVVLDSTSATIAIPALPLAPDVGAKFDRQTISSSYDEQRDELYFNPYDVEPGEHTLELTLVPPQFSETNALLSLPILRSPSARLELSASMDAPALDVPNAMGRVTRGAGWLVAELGSVDRLMLSIQEPSDFLAAGSADVEQLFLARPRATQLDVRAVFRRQTPGKKIKTLEIECDPSYAFSGTCQYDEGEIESVEPPAEQNNVLRVTFKEPTTGPFTLNVGFIARNFSGVGRVQFPRISVRDVRALRNWFAVSPGPDVEFTTEPEFVRSSTLDAFKKAWGTVDDTITSAYDLSALPLDAAFSVGAKVAQLQIDSTTTCLFDVSETETRCDASVQAPNDLFRLSVKTPLPFNVDSIALTDERGTALEQPDYFMTDDVLTLVFQSPVKGRVNLQIVGRTKTALGEERVFPTFKFLTPSVGRRFARLYRAPDVFFEWNDSKGWLASESADAPGVAWEPNGDYRLVGFYEFVDDSARAGLRTPGEYSYEVKETEPDVDAAVGDGAKCVVRMNSPRFVGVEETALFHELNSPLWQAKVYFRFSVESGVADRFLILDDEAFSWEIEDLESRFNVSETTSYSGARAIALTPKKGFGDQIDVRLNATFKNDPDAVRLPKFQLLPSSPREDVSGVERYVALPERKMTDRQNERLNWTTQDLRDVVDDAKKNSVNNATSSIMSSIVKESTPAVDKLKKELLGDVRNVTGGLADYEFSFYFREPTASAKLLSESANLSVSRARHSFYMNAQYEYFGSSSFMIRKSSLDYCTLVVPNSCELLETTVNGSRRLVDYVGSDENQSYWRVDLDTTPYVKRVEASFRGSSKMPPNAQANYGSRRTPAFCADFIAIGEELPETGEVRRVNPERVYWLCAFESLDAERMRWRVFEREEGQAEKTPTKSERANAEREPILWTEANDLLFRFCVENASSLLEAYESDLSQLSGSNADDLARLRAWWDLTWRDSQNATAQFSEAPEGVTERLRRAMFVVEKGQVVSPENELADPTSRWGRAQYDETMRQKAKLDEAYRVDGDSLPAPSAYVASPQSLWTYDAGASTSLLFGVSDGDASQVIVASTPKSFDFFGSHYSTAAFILVLTAFFMSFLKRGAKRSAFGSFYVGVFVAVWTVVFFLLDRKQIGLIGALIFSVGPAAVSSLYRRFKNRANKEEPEPVEEDGSTIEPDLLARKLERELASTETLEHAASSEEPPEEEGEFASGSETQLTNQSDDETSYEEQFD
ncbi:MAG: hypothetical protein IK077_06345 [Thermoguttaceae bacterium]|nr:hypothetical protein [Thermoguttaceae bacterium]